MFSPGGSTSWRVDRQEWSKRIDPPGENNSEFSGLPLAICPGDDPPGCVWPADPCTWVFERSGIKTASELIAHESPGENTWHIKHLQHALFALNQTSGYSDSTDLWNPSPRAVVVSPVTLGFGRGLALLRPRSCRLRFSPGLANDDLDPSRPRHSRRRLRSEPERLSEDIAL